MNISKNLDKIIQGKKQLFLLDLSWHLHRSFHSHNYMQVTNQGLTVPTGHIYGVLDCIRLIKTTYPESAVIICKDGIPVRRRELLEDRGIVYKSERSELEYDIFKDIDVIEALTSAVKDTYFAYNPDQESDDLMYALARQSEQLDSNLDIYIYSGDDDLLQSIRNRTYVIRRWENGEPVIIDRDYVINDVNMIKKFRGTEPDKLRFYRPIIGDKSDKIPGIPRFPRDIASKLANTSSNVNDLFNRVPESSKEEKWFKVLLDNSKDVKSNYLIMTLNEDLEINLTNRKVSSENLVKLINYYQLKTFFKFIQEQWL